MAVEISVFEDAVRFLPMQIEMMHQDNLVLGQSARFVSAQDIHGPEVLDRVETLYDHPLARHRDGALGKIDGHDHRQHFGCQPDSNGEGEHERLEPITLSHAIDEKDARHHHCHEANHQPGETRYPSIKTSRSTLTYEHPGKLAEISAGAGLDDGRGANPAQHVAAHKADIGQVGRRIPLAVDGWS